MEGAHVTLASDDKSNKLIRETLRGAEKYEETNVTPDPTTQS